MLGAQQLKALYPRVRWHTGSFNMWTWSWRDMFSMAEFIHNIFVICVMIRQIVLDKIRAFIGQTGRKNTEIIHLYKYDKRISILLLISTLLVPPIFYHCLLKTWHTLGKVPQFRCCQNSAKKFRFQSGASGVNWRSYPAGRSLPCSEDFWLGLGQGCYLVSPWWTQHHSHQVSLAQTWQCVRGERLAEKC